MGKTVYDVIQRFEVDNGIPRLISTNIQVITGGEDLMSLAISLLAEYGFHKMFEEKRASQYVGYKLKNPKKGAKRYQLILSQRKEELCVSIPKEILEPHLLVLKYHVPGDQVADIYSATAGRFWVLPSKKDVFLNSLHPNYWDLLQIEEKTTGVIYLNDYNHDGWFGYEVLSSPISDEFSSSSLSNSSSYVAVNPVEDKLFPYAWQVSISSTELLNEFLSYFAKILIDSYQKL